MNGFDVEEKFFQPKNTTPDTAKYSFIQWLNIDDDILFKLELVLKGYNYDAYVSEDGQIGLKINTEIKGTPKCNEVGIRDILSFMNMHLNKNVRMSNVDKGEVYRDIKEVYYDINCYIYENYDKWELDLNFYDALVNIMAYNIWFSYNRAKDEGERKQASRQYSESSVKQTVESKSDKKEGFFSRF